MGKFMVFSICTNRQFRGTGLHHERRKRVRKEELREGGEEDESGEEISKRKKSLKSRWKKLLKRWK